MNAEPALYSIRVGGHLGETVLSAFPTLVAECQDPGAQTVLTGLLDLSALYGVLAQMERLGLDLIEVTRPGAAER
ncbi:hypothetical protein ABH935_001142 [Catenulispora sp. GAS73]|uniref:hypothetical protein n=1 Tax=Catenulispora sp. GAS73 TaxID=3156269 RepID=UPI00351907A2